MNIISADLAGHSHSPPGLFLVCGLGSLGQHCVVALKHFGVKVVAIELAPPPHWELNNFSELLDDLIVGDCRRQEVLSQGEYIYGCRGVLLVTSDEQVNIETALAIRQLNPHTRLVVRSAQTHLNQLLAEQLGNYSAYEPLTLPAHAFTIAALGTEILGYFELDGQQLQVIQHRIQPQDFQTSLSTLAKFNTRTCRLLAHQSTPSPLFSGFHRWHPDEPLRAGDTLTYIKILETTHSFSVLPPTASASPRQSSFAQVKKRLRDRWQTFWQLNLEQQVQRVAVVCGLIVLCLLLIGTILFQNLWAELTWLSAFSMTAILLLGGYGDWFWALEATEGIPQWLQLFSLLLTLAGTAFLGVLYALVINTLLSSRFQLAQHAPAVPAKNHIIVVGLEQMGQRVIKLLQDLNHPLVGITFNKQEVANLLTNIPIVVSPWKEALDEANLATAKSIVILSKQEIFNLEVALLAQKINPHSHLVIRTEGQRIAQHLHQLLPHAQVLNTYGVAAEVFAGAAFGENILHLFQLHHQTILVTEYQIEVEDTLNGLLLAEVAYGYGVIPLLHQKPGKRPKLMPADHLRLQVGERLVILATIEGLRCIEQGQLRAKRWQVYVESVLNEQRIFEGGNAIFKITGCPLKTARQLMKQLPATVPVPLYHYQALRLVRALKKVQVKAHLYSDPDSSKQGQTDHSQQNHE